MKRNREVYLIRIVWSRYLSWNGFGSLRIHDVTFDNYNRMVFPRRTTCQLPFTSGLLGRGG